MCKSKYSDEGKTHPPSHNSCVGYPVQCILRVLSPLRSNRSEILNELSLTQGAGARSAFDQPLREATPVEALLAAWYQHDGIGSAT
jgi:hypothetical protein